MARTFWCGLLAAAGFLAQADDRVLSDQAWRADLQQLEVAIREEHFQPFHTIEVQEFDSSVEQLSEDIPDLSDHEIIVGMARLVAAIGDGHTRLAIPVADHDQLARLSHSPPVEPNHAALRFRQLPLRLRIFADGIFVVAAAQGLQSLVGAELLAMDGVDIETVIERVAPTVSHDNQGTLNFLAPNHIIMPALLRACGIPGEPGTVSLTLKMPGADSRSIDIDADDGDVPDKPGRPGYAASRVDRALLLEINQIGDDPHAEQPSLADFMGVGIARAEREKLRVVIDLRRNTGGSNSLNQAILQSILRSRVVDRPGALYVLIGGRTFSAAQSLVNDLERLSHVIFVGEPTGSSPSHYGDAKKLGLDNSGLMLRVSSIWWQSWLAGDFRDATPPHLAVAETSTDHFSGRDAALHAAMTHVLPADAVEWFGKLIERGQVNAAAIHFAKHSNDPATDRATFARRILALGESYLDAGEEMRAYYLYAVADSVLPSSARLKTGLGRAYELRENRGEAITAYRQALDIEPGAMLARTRLEALTGEAARKE